MTVIVALGWVSLEQSGGILVQRAFPRSPAAPLIRHILGQVPQYLSEYSTLFWSSFMSFPVLKICPFSTIWWSKGHTALGGQLHSTFLWYQSHFALCTLHLFLYTLPSCPVNWSRWIRELGGGTSEILSGLCRQQLAKIRLLLSSIEHNAHSHPWPF